MSSENHRFSDYLLDPVPEKLWRHGRPIEGTRLGFCETCGFYHVDPYPGPEYLAEYYANYEMPTPQANLAETARLLARNLSVDASVVDMGCGDGGFLKELHALGFDKVTGFDQSPGLDRAKALGFGSFYRSNVWAYLDEAEQGAAKSYDAYVMVNVLEHVTEPMTILRRLHRVMKPGATLCVTVPNDFSKLQRAFLKVKGHLPWFVCLPDHVNYFDFDTLRHALGNAGFEVVDQSALYPLELFLLQDLDYIASPELGPVAHARRVEFENNMKQAGMMAELDHFYATLAAGGYGRDVMVVATRR
ncbi:MAG: class I SAM-dependent methyltransferase [Deltaproteobacteria bacterium]|nr:MAG: class I SAM-dependent methyltransferase [Deltaproteobacteria bacterium]